MARALGMATRFYDVVPPSQYLIPAAVPPDDVASVRLSFRRSASFPVCDAASVPSLQRTASHGGDLLDEDLIFLSQICALCQKFAKKEDFQQEALPVPTIPNFESYCCKLALLFHLAALWHELEWPLYAPFDKILSVHTESVKVSFGSAITSAHLYTMHPQGRLGSYLAPDFITMFTTTYGPVFLSQFGFALEVKPSQRSDWFQDPRSAEVQDRTRNDMREHIEADRDQLKRYVKQLRIDHGGNDSMPELHILYTLGLWFTHLIFVIRKVDENDDHDNLAYVPRIPYFCRPVVSWDEANLIEGFPSSVTVTGEFRVSLLAASKHLSLEMYDTFMDPPQEFVMPVGNDPVGLISLSERESADASINDAFAGALVDSDEDAAVEESTEATTSEYNTEAQPNPPRERRFRSLQKRSLGCSTKPCAVSSPSRLEQVIPYTADYS
ncbi:hypothetical protein K466DRAFT_563148 [Polyporus arcularius HHB13444]|uniref:Uncharacterized protein n=1 Tax=Polyporus arcularius HHB13444 TaxID=1314778 RepID=A0A5C3PP82_9APHY|nr:hypothetical protein K466DRAFT_563148 [Polyporus arcularius HHB13444]